MSQNIEYVLIARGPVVLAEAWSSGVGGNANLVALKIAEKLGQEDTRVSYTQDRHMFHCLVRDGLTFLVMAEESFGRRIPFALLEDVKNRFLASYGAAREAVAYEYQTEFAPVLAERMQFYGTNSQADTLNRVKAHREIAMRLRQLAFPRCRRPPETSPRRESPDVEFDEG